MAIMPCPTCGTDRHAECCRRCGRIVPKTRRGGAGFCKNTCAAAQAVEDARSAHEEEAVPETLRFTVSYSSKTVTIAVGDVLEDPDLHADMDDAEIRRAIRETILLALEREMAPSWVSDMGPSDVAAVRAALRAREADDGE